VIYVVWLRLLLNWLKSRPGALFLCSGLDSAKEQLCSDGAGGEGTKLGHWAAGPAHKSGHQCPAFSNQVDPNFRALSPLTLPLGKSTWSPPGHLSYKEISEQGWDRDPGQRNTVLVYLPLLLALTDRMRTACAGFVVYFFYGLPSGFPDELESYSVC